MQAVTGSGRCHLEEQGGQLLHDSPGHQVDLPDGAHHHAKGDEQHVEDAAAREALRAEGNTRRIDKAWHERLSHLDERH